MNILYDVERFLKQTGMPASQFGRMVARDPCLVRDMRNGREPRPRLRANIASHLAQHRQDVRS